MLLLYFIMLLPQACNFIKKETQVQVFTCEFCEISKNTFFTEHLWVTASNSSLRLFIEVFELYTTEKRDVSLANNLGFYATFFDKLLM